MKYQVPVRR